MTVAGRRLARQRLVGDPLASPEAVVGHLLAVQAQDYPGAAWGIAQRTTPTTAAAIDALLDAGALVRTHLLRPTWHLVLPADVRWLLALTAPRVHRVNGGMYRQCGLDADVFAGSDAVIAAAVRDGNHLTRPELADRLAEHGIAATGFRLAYLVMHAELEGLICSGPLRGRRHTYALLDERVPPTPARSREEALAELARRYLASRAPATPHDLGTWSGLTVADARAGIAALGGEVAAETIEGVSYWSPADDPARVQTAGPTAHLLPNYDEYVSGYRDDGPVLPPAIRAALAAAPAALDGHLVVVDGRLAGGWRRDVAGRSVTVRPTLLRPLDGDERAALRVEAARYGRFLGKAVAVAETSAPG